MKKQIIIGGIILIVLILLPFAINFFIQIPAQFDVVGEPVNWLMFWPMTFPKFSRQFFDYFPKLVDTLPNFVDTFLKK